MIKDNLQHISYYNYLTKELQLSLKYLKDTDFSAMENGRYEVIEGKVFALVQDYTSKPESEGKFEAHKKYIDIQFIVKGEEKIGKGILEDFEETTPYDEEKDIVFLAPKEDAKIEFIKLKEDEFAIFTPNDVHMPALAIDEPAYVKKVVVKVLA